MPYKNTVCYPLKVTLEFKHIVVVIIIIMIYQQHLSPYYIYDYDYTIWGQSCILILILANIA